MNYYEVQIQYEIDLDNGKSKKIKEKYLVDALSITEAEAVTKKFLPGTYDVLAAKPSPITGLIERTDLADRDDEG